MVDDEEPTDANWIISTQSPEVIAVWHSPLLVHGHGVLDGVWETCATKKPLNDAVKFPVT